MRTLKHLNTFIACALALALAGCGETTPDDIKAWQAAGKSAKIIKALDLPQQYMKLAAIEALHEMRAKDAIDALSARVGATDKVVAHAAIDALAAIGGHSVEAPMLEALKVDTPPARLTASKTLGTLKSKAAIEPLSALLDNPYREVKVAAAEALGQIGDPKAIPALAKSAKVRDASLREASLSAIAAIGGEDAMALLAKGMGDSSENVRASVVESLVAFGEDAKPYALTALRGKTPFHRSDAIAVLERTKSVPTNGADRLWYELAKLSLAKRNEETRAAAAKLGEIEDSHNALIEAVAHPDETVREPAFTALMAIGEPVAETVVSNALANATPDALAWLKGRENWAGGPDWRLDLWGGATALNPDFYSLKSTMKILRDSPKQASTAMSAKKFSPRRELIPLLIAQFGTINSELSKAAGQPPSVFSLTIPDPEAKPSETESRAKVRHARAQRRLIEAGANAELPLFAALNDKDPELVARVAQTLVAMKHPEAPAAIVAAYSARMASGEEMYGSPLYNTLLTLDIEGVEELLLKTRPNGRRAEAVFSKKYPGVQVVNMPLPHAEPHPSLEPFKLSYVKDGKTNEMRIVFQRDGLGEWHPKDPLPDELP